MAFAPFQSTGATWGKTARGELGQGGTQSAERIKPRGRIAAARALEEFGVTTINIADGPGVTCMGNVAMVEIQETGLTLVHVLSGSHHLTASTSWGMCRDSQRRHHYWRSTQEGPFPHATGVYDVNSIGLLNVINGFNHGVDSIGSSLPEPTEFVCATGAEPAALDYDRELRRLDMKVSAGADVIMTQPVYDPYKVERFLKDVRRMGTPIMLGVCPLASYRNAKFLDENVPGMKVPDYVMERMREADEKGEGQAEGIRIARETLTALRDEIQGAYIMPPFGRYRVAMSVLEGFV